MKSTLYLMLNRAFTQSGPIQLYKTLKSLNTKEKLQSHFNSQTNLKDFIENLRVAISVYQTHHSFPFNTIIPEILPRFHLVQSQLPSYDYSDLSSLLYILKISKENKISLLYSPIYEKKLLSVIENSLNDSIDQKILMNLFRDLGLINKLFEGIEKIVLGRLENPKKLFSADDLRKVLNATTYCKSPRLEGIEKLALDRFHNLNFLLAGNSELSECLRVLASVNKKRDISDLLQQIMTSLALRSNFLTFRETKQILELYTLVSTIEKGCLHDTLNRIQELMCSSNEIEINEFLEAIKYYKKLVRTESQKMHYNGITELFIDKTIKLHNSKQLSFIKTFETLSDLEDLCVNLPASIRNFVSNYDDNTTSGYWQLLHIKIKSKYSQLLPEAFENFRSLKSNLETSSIYLQARSLEKIYNTKQFTSYPQLLEMQELLVNNIIENCDNWSNIKKLMAVFDSIKHILTENDLKKIFEKCFIMFRKPSDNITLDIFRVFFNFYIEDKKCKKIWEGYFTSVSHKIKNPVGNIEIFNTFEANKLEPIFFILSTLKLDTDEHIANYISVGCENFENIDLEITARVVKNAELGFLIHKNFRFSANGLLAYLVSNSEKFSFSGFLERVEEFAKQVKINSELHQELIKFLSWSQKLSPILKQQILSHLKKQELKKNFSQIVFELSGIPGVFDSYPQDFANFLQFSPGSHIKDLKFRLFAYLNMNFSLPGESEFINYIIPILFIGENKAEFLSTLKFLCKSSIRQQSLKAKLLKTLTKFVLKDFSSYPLYILHEVLIEILKTQGFDLTILQELEDKVLLHRMSPSFSVNLIETYAELGRFNEHFDNLCKNLNQTNVFPYLEKLGNVCKGRGNNVEGLVQLGSLVESKNY